jgi:predicted amidophosphoribosyltransferase
VRTLADVRLLDLLLPRRCAVCRSPGDDVCGPCLEQLPRLGPPLCARCGAPTAWPVARCRECSGRRLAFASARAAVAYDDAVRAVVAAWKEHGLRRLGIVAADVVAEAVHAPPVDAVAAVPPDGERILERGHHPAERLATELAVRWTLPALPLLVRTRAGIRQRGLTLAARRRNVAGAFAARGRAPPRVALVDDVYTTGATASAAASALRRAGARRVEVVTFARAIRGG